MNKICTKCKVEKDVSGFYKSSKTKDGLKCQCKDCARKYDQENREKIAEYKKRYNEENRVHLYEKNREWRQRNREKCKGYIRKYYQNNKEKCTKAARKYYQANREKYIQYSSRYRYKNKSACIERTKRWRENNREKIAEKRKKYNKENPFQIQSSRLMDKTRHRAKYKKIPIDLDFISKPNMLDWLKRQPNCVCCNRVFSIGVKGKPGFKDDSPSLDRFYPSLGYVPGNVFLICMRCNVLKRDATRQELETVVAWMKKVKNQMVCKP